MPTDRASRLALLFSLLLHALLAAPAWERWGVRAERPPVEPPRPSRLAFRFVDEVPAPEAPPDQPTDRVSIRSHRAAQPEAPPDRPPGEAFQRGLSAVPATPRAMGSPAARSPSTAPVPPAPAGRQPDEGAGPGASADRRLAVPRDPIALRPARPGPTGDGPLPSPEVDQRLTRATAGSAFSLNTTAWDYAPYLARLKARIEAHIFPPPAFYYGTVAWSTRVRFRIDPDGRLSGVTLLDHRGVESLQYVALDAVEGAAAYEPLPPDFPEPYLEITGGFYFNVLPEGRR